MINRPYILLNRCNRVDQLCNPLFLNERTHAVAESDCSRHKYDVIEAYSLASSGKNNSKHGLTYLKINLCD